MSRNPYDGEYTKSLLPTSANTEMTERYYANDNRSHDHLTDRFNTPHPAPTPHTGHPTEDLADHYGFSQPGNNNYVAPTPPPVPPNPYHNGVHSATPAPLDFPERPGSMDHHDLGHTAHNPLTQDTSYYGAGTGAAPDPYGPDPYAPAPDAHFYDNNAIPAVGGANLYQQNSYQHDPAPFVPEEGDSYLLKPYGQQQQHHSLGVFDNGNYNDTEADLDNFVPFPIAGDTYALNTYEDSEEDEPNVQMPDSFAGSRRSFESGDDEDDDEDDDDETFEEPSAFGSHVPPPDVQPRRRKTVKRVRLFRGNLVLDCPVSKKLLSKYPEPRREREFTHMRYSAATCDPSEFVPNQFTLRQKCYQQPRQTELFIVVTMYNEDDILLGRTLQGVFKNIKHLTTRSRSKVWGKDAWKKVVVCVVSDGREKINPRARALMAALGVYQDGFAKNIVNDQPVAAHIYEYTTMVGISSVDKSVKLTTEKTIPIQMIFCLKEKNQKKINSHRWFFQAFGPVLNPNVCILLDAGTQPGHDSIYHLWKAFDSHADVGGACGEIKAMLGKGGKHLMNPLVAAQNFEYKMSNILDKPLESVFGFISVLPGAFSAYRYVALQNDVNGVGPLEKYFKGETLHDSGAGIFTANMYLAEDRILCFELVAKKNCSWKLKYVKSSSAETDVPDHLSELVMQRRRWLNGSFFAAIYSSAHFYQIWRSSHSIGRKLFFHLEFIYQTFTMLFSWFAIGNFFLVFRILTSALGDPSMHFAPGNVLGVVFLWLYCCCIVATFVLAFGNRPTGTQAFYTVVVAFFAVLMAYLIFAAIYISVKAVSYALCSNGGKLTLSLVFTNATFRDLVVSLCSTYALYFVMSFLYFEPWHMFTSFLQYMLISPSYINVLNVYAFCNIHDISWGTKGDTAQKMDLGVAKTNQAGKLEVDIPTQEMDIDSSYMNEINTLQLVVKEEKKQPSKEDKETDYYALVRSSVVLFWMLTNFVVIAVVLNAGGLSIVSTDPSQAGGAAGSPGAPAVPQLVRRGIKHVLEARQNADQCEAVGGATDVRTEIYLRVVLWSVAALSCFRGIGATWYLIARLFGH